MSDNPSKEIIENPLRFNFNDMQLRRKQELEYYDSFFGVIELEELDNGSDEQYEGFL